MGGMFLPLKPAARYPADPRAVFILMLSVFSGLTALAIEVAPGSLQALLPHWAVVLWGVLLSGGSLVTLVGMSRPTVNGIIVEQVGSVTVGCAAIFYSILAAWFVGPGSLQSVGIIFAWGVACLIRWGQLQVLINDSVRRARKSEYLAKFEAELAARAERERRRRKLHEQSEQSARRWGGQ